MHRRLEILKNKIDICLAPFSFPGSRLLLQKHAERDSLYIRLAERLVSIFPGIESYLSRDPYIDDLIFIDEQSQPLDFKIITYPHLIIFKTRLGNFQIMFDDIETIIICLPNHQECGIKFKMQADNWHSFENKVTIHSYRDLTYLTNATIYTNQITRKNSQCKVEFKVLTGTDSIIQLTTNSTDSKISASSVNPQLLKTKAEEGWLYWLKKIPDTVNEKYKEKYFYAWWVLLNNMLSPRENITHEMLVPSKKSYIGVWLWDNAFHAIALRHLDPDLARNQIRGVIAHQLPNGMLPDAIFDDGIVYEIDHPFKNYVTKPPILAWAALKIHEIKPDNNFLEEIYEPLVKWNTWWFTHNGSDEEGIVQYNHPYSSGMDDHPTWDFPFPIKSPDINAYLVVQMQSLAKISEIINKKPEAAAWQNKSNILQEKIIDYFWDEVEGSFRVFHDQQQIHVSSVLNLFPIISGGLGHCINQSILDHLNDPAEFGGEFIIPTVARNDPKFSPDSMWRGPVWVNINYLFIEALIQLDKIEFAEMLIKKTLDIINDNDGIYEYYNATTGKPGMKAAVSFSWTAAVFIDLVIRFSNQRSIN